MFVKDASLSSYHMSVAVGSHTTIVIMRFKSHLDIANTRIKRMLKMINFLPGHLFRVKPNKSSRTLPKQPLLSTLRKGVVLCVVHWIWDKKWKILVKSTWKSFECWWERIYQKRATFSVGSSNGASGLVIEKQCKFVCKSCINVFKCHCKPKFALSNGLWIGDVPTEVFEVFWKTIGSTCTIQQMYFPSFCG